MSKEKSPMPVGSSPESAASSNSLDGVALRGAAWMGVAKWSTQLVSWLGTIMVARILSPADYGIVAMASVYLGLLSLVSEFGIGTTIVSHRDIRGVVVDQLNSVALLLGLVCFAVTLALAFPLGGFFRSEDLPWVVVAMSTTFVINALQTVPAATLRRELQFRTLATIEIVRGILVPVGTLAFALLGFRYWSLVGGAVLSAAVSAGMTLLSRRHGFAAPLWSGLATRLRFSIDVLVSRLAWFVYSSSDLVVAGRRLGEAPLGEYSLAVTLATMPTSKIFALLADVTPALFAAVNDQRDALRRYFLNMTELLAFVCFPVGLGLSLVSNDLILVLLGEKWVGAGAPLMLLAAYSVVRALTPLYGHLFLAVGDARFSMWTAIATAVALPLGFVIGSHWGTTGIALTWFFVHPVLTWVTFARVRKILSLRARDYLQALRIGLDGTVVMCIAVLVLRVTTDIEGPFLRLSLDVFVGMMAFVLTTVVLHRARVAEIVAWFQRTRKAG